MCAGCRDAASSAGISCRSPTGACVSMHQQGSRAWDALPPLAIALTQHVRAMTSQGVVEKALCEALWRGTKDIRNTLYLGYVPHSSTTDSVPRRAEAAASRTWRQCSPCRMHAGAPRNAAQDQCLAGRPRGFTGLQQQIALRSASIRSVRLTAHPVLHGSFP
jgi:hypothetical protein